MYKSSPTYSGPSRRRTTSRAPVSMLLLLLVLLLPGLYGFDPFNTSNSNIEQGNALFKSGKIKEALTAYDKAVKELPDEAGVHYNRGIALHKLGKFKEARDALLKATMATDPSLKAKSLYNLGNAHLSLKKYKEAVAAYKRSLQLNVGHRSSKWNLELALRKVQEQKKKDKQKKKNKKNKDNKKNDKKKQGKKNKKDNKDDKNKKDQKRDKKDKSRAKNEPQKNKQQRKRMNSVLDALDRNDKNLQRRRARIKAGRRRRPEKDW